MSTATVEHTDEATDEAAVSAEETDQECPQAGDPHDEAASLIKKHVLISMGIGLVPSPGIDLAGLVGQQLYMAQSLGKLYGVEFRKDLGRKAVVTLLGAAAPTSGLQLAAGSLLKAIPVVGQAASAFSMPLLAGAATYAVGNVLNLHFASGGTFLSFDPKRYSEQFKKQLQEGMEVAKDAQSDDAESDS